MSDGFEKRGVSLALMEAVCAFALANVLSLDTGP
jgi:hypothetical protein